MRCFFFWHSEGLSKQKGELLETVWRLLMGSRCSWIIECDANMESEEMSKGKWFQELGAVTVATYDLAGAHRVNVAAALFT